MTHHDADGSVPAALRTSRLGRRYAKVWGLRDCTMELPAGAGKTTLLEMIIGLLEPTEGQVEVLGETSRADTARTLARTGYVAQDHPLYRDFTVADMFHLGQAMNPGWDQDMATARLGRLGIPLQRRVRRLSGGQQAQVSLTMALAKRAPLVVLDEPVSSLDPVARLEFMRDVMAAAADQALTFLISSHVVAELERFYRRNQRRSRPGRVTAGAEHEGGHPMMWVTWRQHRTQGTGCLDAVRAFRDEFGSAVNVAFWSVCLIIPGVIGILVGGSLIARELEYGTWRLAWSQTVPRTQWLAVKLALVTGGLIVLVLTAFMTPLTMTNPACGGPPGCGFGVGFTPQATGRVGDLVLGLNGTTVTYQPADRFWPFQSIEGGIFVALTAAALAATIWLLHRRASWTT